MNHLESSVMKDQEVTITTGFCSVTPYLSPTTREGKRIICSFFDSTYTTLKFASVPRSWLRELLHLCRIIFAISTLLILWKSVNTTSFIYFSAPPYLYYSSSFNANTFREDKPFIPPFIFAISTLKILQISVKMISFMYFTAPPYLPYSCHFNANSYFRFYKSPE